MDSFSESSKNDSRSAYEGSGYDEPVYTNQVQLNYEDTNEAESVVQALIKNMKKDYVTLENLLGVTSNQSHITVGQFWSKMDEHYKLLPREIQHQDSATRNVIVTYLREEIENMSSEEAKEEGGLDSNNDDLSMSVARIRTIFNQNGYSSAVGILDAGDNEPQTSLFLKNQGKETRTILIKESSTISNEPFIVAKNSSTPSIKDFKLPFRLNEDCDTAFQEDLVYPLSVKIYPKKICKRLTMKYLSIGILFLILILFIVLSILPSVRKLPVRVGYFANQIIEESVSINGVTEFAIKTKNCEVFLLENTESMTEIELYISGPRPTTVSTGLDGTIQNIEVIADMDTVVCYAEIRIPGGVIIPSLKFTFEGDTIPDLLVRDFKKDSKWITPMIIQNLEISISDSYPSIQMTSAHQIDSMTISATFCIAEFLNVKIEAMTFTAVLGSLNILQHSDFPINKMVVRTPKGTHCVSGNAVNSDDTDCPTDEERAAGVSGTFVNTATYCESTLFVCSDAAGACPASATAVAAGQGSFTITLDDGPVQFLIDGSTTTASSTYIPTLDTFAISSQIKLTENKDDYSTEPEDPRIYLYEVVSPGYAKMWSHSSLKQYIEARPWFISLLSVNLLRPTFARDTLVHLPGGECPYAIPSSVKTNTLVSEKIRELSFIETRHLVSAKEDNTFFEYILTAENEYVRNEIPFLGNNIYIWICLAVSLLIGLFSVVLITIIFFKLFNGVNDMYNKYLDEARRFSESKKAKSKTTYVPKSKKEYVMGLFTLTEKEVVIKPSKSQNKKDKKRRNLVNLTVFKMIDINLDYILRIRADSYMKFLESIYEDRSYFMKSSSSQKSEDRGVRLDTLNLKYLEFCTKNGYRVMNIEIQDKTMKKFDIKIKKVADSTTNAYTKIRWKTNLEKANDEAEAEKSKCDLASLTY